MDSVTQLFTNFPLDLCMLGSLLSLMSTSATGQPTVSSREATDVSPWPNAQGRSTSQRVSSQPRYLARPEPVETRHDSAELAGMSYRGTASQLDAAMLEAVERSDSDCLKKLFDAHPHAAPEPADSSAGAAIRRFFRKIASWFNSDAWAWQGKKAVTLLNAAARAGNAETIRILLDRGMDLGRNPAVIKDALRIAVKHGKADAAGLLLREILRVEPAYARNTELLDQAALAGHTNVVKVLSDCGMALPWKNSRLRSMSIEAKEANAALIKAVARRFENFIVFGAVPPDMRQYLADQGMYGVLADMVVDAARSAATSSSWNAVSGNRRALFATALGQSAQKWADSISKAGVDSGNAYMFDKLLRPQLEMLITYCGSCQTANASS